MGQNVEISYDAAIWRIPVCEFCSTNWSKVTHIGGDCPVKPKEPKKEISGGEREV